MFFHSFCPSQIDSEFFFFPPNQAEESVNVRPKFSILLIAFANIYCDKQRFVHTGYGIDDSSKTYLI
jgi:hypothetical protein